MTVKLKWSKLCSNVIKEDISLYQYYLQPLLLEQAKVERERERGDGGRGEGEGRWREGREMESEKGNGGGEGGERERVMRSCKCYYVPLAINGIKLFMLQLIFLGTRPSPYQYT